MATNEAWGREVRRAWHEWEERHGQKLTLQVVGARVAKLVKRKQPFSHPAVQAWRKGTVPDAMEVVTALVDVLEGEPERFRAVFEAAIPFGAPAPSDHEEGARAYLERTKKAAQKAAPKKRRA